MRAKVARALGRPNPEPPVECVSTPTEGAPIRPHRRSDRRRRELPQPPRRRKRLPVRRSGGWFSLLATRESARVDPGHVASVTNADGLDKRLTIALTSRRSTSPFGMRAAAVSDLRCWPTHDAMRMCILNATDCGATLLCPRDPADGESRSSDVCPDPPDGNGAEPKDVSG